MSQDFIPVQTISSPPEQLHIASLVAHVRPTHFAIVREWLSGYSGQGLPGKFSQKMQVEIHAEEPLAGKLVIVAESGEEKCIVDFMDELRGQSGVLNAALVYHEYLSERDLQDEQR